jgi:thioredoxin 1
VGVVIAMKQRGSPSDTEQARTAPGAPENVGLPRHLDLGSVTCIPCKMMAPILEELRKEYAGRLQVEFIDVLKDPDAGRTHGIFLIPTQIFFDAFGNELWRHEGFISKEDMLEKWEELGIDLSRTSEKP